MTREEIKQAIENGKSVWLVFGDRIYKLDRSKIIDINDCYIEYYNNYYECNLYATVSDFYETEARAKHFISHCGVTRTETLPFLTWDEFLKERKISFKDYQDYSVYLYFTNNNKNLSLFCINPEHENQYFDATEANFYKAYDECVRLFKGEE